MVSIEELLDEMDTLLDKSKAVPFGGGKAMVNIDRLRELIDDIRLHIPLGGDRDYSTARRICKEMSELF